jgi:hypothetical protein
VSQTKRGEVFTTSSPSVSSTLAQVNGNGHLWQELPIQQSSCGLQHLHTKGWSSRNLEWLHSHSLQSFHTIHMTFAWSSKTYQSSQGTLPMIQPF